MGVYDWTEAMAWVNPRGMITVAMSYAIGKALTKSGVVDRRYFTGHICSMQGYGRLSIMVTIYIVTLFVALVSRGDGVITVVIPSAHQVSRALAECALQEPSEAKNGEFQKAVVLVMVFAALATFAMPT